MRSVPDLLPTTRLPASEAIALQKELRSRLILRADPDLRVRHVGGADVSMARE